MKQIFIIITLLISYAASAQPNGSVISGGVQATSTGGGGGGSSNWTRSGSNLYPNSAASTNVGTGTTTPLGKFHAQGDNSRIVVSPAGDGAVMEYTDGADTSFVVGVSAGDVYLRANVDGTDYDVVLNVSDPAGVKIQGKDSSTTSNALTIFRGADNPYQGSRTFWVRNDGLVTANRNLQIGNSSTSAGQLVLLEDSDNGSHSVTLQSPSALSASYSLTLPADDGTSSGQVLTTNGTGTLSWTTPGSQVWEQANSTTITSFNDSLAFQYANIGIGTGFILATVYTNGIALLSDGSLVFLDADSNPMIFNNDTLFVDYITGEGGTTVQSIQVEDLFVATTTPASAGAACTTGQITWDSNYMYVCVATNTWKRSAIATW